MRKYFRKIYKFYVQKVFPRIRNHRGSDFLQMLLKPLTYSGRFTLDKYRDFDVKINPREYVGGEVYKEQNFEPELAVFLEEELEKGDTVIEIGGHIGLHTLLIRRLIGEEGTLHTFEPHPENRKLLRDNLDLNGYEDVFVSEYAVSNGRGASELYHNSQNTGGSSMIEPQDRNEETFKIETIPLQKYVSDQNIGKIDLIKIDVEGKELDVLDGIDFQNTKIGKLVIELHWDRIDSERWREKISGWDVVTDLDGEVLNAQEDLEILKKNLSPNFIVLKNR